MLHVFEELGHESYVRRAPKEWKRCVESFLNQAPEKSSRRALCDE
jgi:hypothetical protein